MQSRLFKLILERIEQLNITEPVYAMRVYYYGTDSDDTCTPTLLLPYVRTQKRLIEKNPGNFSDYIWSADEHDCKDDGVFAYLKDEELEGLYRKWYAHLCRSKTQKSTLHQFRRMVQRVCKKLNKMDWSDLAMATEDFVVFPADGAHEFCNDYAEMVASLTNDQIKKLISKGLLDAKYVSLKMRLMYSVERYFG